VRVDPNVSAEDLDLVPTETLWDALERRTDAAVLVVQRRSNQQARGGEADERELSFHGGLATAIGLVEIAKDLLIHRWRNPDA